MVPDRRVANRILCHLEMGKQHEQGKEQIMSGFLFLTVSKKLDKGH